MDCLIDRSFLFAKLILGVIDAFELRPTYYLKDHIKKSGTAYDPLNV